jgi:signal transduction histidine kinase
LVGLSRLHRYENSPFLVSLLRLFISFFSEALENTELYARAATASATYRAIVDALPSGAIAVDESGRIMHINAVAARHLQLADDELEGQPIERAGSILADAAREVLHCGHALGRRALRLPHETFVLSATPLTGADTRGALLVVESMPAEGEQGVTIDTAVETQELWHSMARAIAHNFKNALVPVKTCAELLPERYSSKPFRSSFFEVVNDNIKRIDGWIEDLLRYADIKEDRREWAVVDLHDCIERAVERAVDSYPHANITITRDYSSEDQVEGNPEYLTSTFKALVQNALDAVQDTADPKVILRTEKNGSQVRATIEDNGAGFDKASLNSAFEAFSSTKLSGLGMGLAYAHKIAGLHNGTIEIEPGSDGGSRVEISLPATEKQAPVNST